MNELFIGFILLVAIYAITGIEDKCWGGNILYLETFQDMCDDETICQYCLRTGYGEYKQSWNGNGYDFCEGAWCKESYERYLDDFGATENLVKYQNKVTLTNIEEVQICLQN